MAKIAKQERTAEFNELVSASKSMNENNDCSVKAVSIVCNVDYQVAHEALANNGRKNRRGAYTHDILKSVKDLGYKFERVNQADIIRSYPKAHQILKSITTHHPKRFNKVWADGETYLFFTSGHVAAVVDGTTHDWSIGRALRCTSIYKISVA